MKENSDILRSSVSSVESGVDWKHPKSAALSTSPLKAKLTWVFLINEGQLKGALRSSQPNWRAA